MPGDKTIEKEDIDLGMYRGFRLAGHYVNRMAEERDPTQAAATYRITASEDETQFTVMIHGWHDDIAHRYRAEDLEKPLRQGALYYMHQHLDRGDHAHASYDWTPHLPGVERGQ